MLLASLYSRAVDSAETQPEQMWPEPLAIPCVPLYIDRGSMTKHFLPLPCISNGPIPSKGTTFTMFPKL